MSRLADAWERTRAIRDAGPAPEPDVLGYADAGERWVRAALARHGLGSEHDIDTLAAIDEQVARVTIPQVTALLATRRLDTASALRAIHASGFTTGLMLGLETHHD